MHKCEYTDRIEIKYKKLVRIVTATWQGKNTKEPLVLEVIKENEELITKCRNVLYSNFGYGYGIIFPNEKYYGSPYGLDEYGLTDNNGKKQLPIFCSNNPSSLDFSTVLKKYPDFKEITDFKKFKSNSELITAIHYWKINKDDFKFLVKNGKTLMAYSDSYYKLSEEKRNRIKKAILSYPTINIPTKKFLKCVSLKEQYPQFNFDLIYSVNNGNTNDKNCILKFLKATKEWNKLSLGQQKEFETFLTTSKKWKCDFFSYPKFRRIVKDKLKYSETSFEDLLDFETDYMSVEELKKFYAQYNNDFIYTVQKMDKVNYRCDTKDIRKIFDIWTRYPRDIEGLFSLNLQSLALSEEYYSQSEDYKKKALKLFLKHKNFFKKSTYLSFSSLNSLMEIDYDLLNIDELTFEYMYSYSHYLKKLSKKQIRYVMNKNIEVDEYSEYLKKCNKAKHDMNDPYWLFPNDFKKRMDKVIEEVNNIEKYEREHKDEIYFETVQKFIKKNPLVKIDGYEIYIPETIEDIKFQADMLKQCLIRMDYPKKVIDNQCLLVFLRKDGEPVATCELKEKEIIQFRQMSNQCVSQDMDIAMNKWLKNAKLKIA